MLVSRNAGGKGYRVEVGLLWRVSFARCGRVWVVNILLHHRGNSYHIVGSFGGRKLSWISRSCGYLWTCSMKFGGVALLVAPVSNPWKFSLQDQFAKVSHYMLYWRLEAFYSLGQTNKIYCFTSPLCSICVWVDGNYSLLANATTTLQIYSAMAIKSGCVIAWKAIMTVEAGTDAKQ